LTTSNHETLPDGVGGTVTGGPMRPMDLMEILSRGGAGTSRGGAVSGAAQVVTSALSARAGRDEGIALSDGSRITFARVGDAGVMREEEALLLIRV
jgi:hypothetical protein